MAEAIALMISFLILMKADQKDFDLQQQKKWANQYLRK